MKIVRKPNPKKPSTHTITTDGKTMKVGSNKSVENEIDRGWKETSEKKQTEESKKLS